MSFRISCVLLGAIHLLVGIAHIDIIADALVASAALGSKAELPGWAWLQVFGGLFWLFMAAIQPRLDRWRYGDDLEGVTPGLHF